MYLLSCYLSCSNDQLNNSKLRIYICIYTYVYVFHVGNLVDFILNSLCLSYCTYKNMILKIKFLRKVNNVLLGRIYLKVGFIWNWVLKPEDNNYFLFS